MRYLLNSPSKILAKAATSAANAAWTPTHVTTEATKTIKVTQQLLHNAVPSTSFTASNINTNFSASERLPVAKTKKWGQQCGVTCGCVVRFELELDDNDRVIMAEYTAKKIITTAIPIPTIPNITALKEIQNKSHNSTSAVISSKQQQQQQQQQQHMQPVFTNRTKRLQYVSCKCSTLHSLCLQSIQYFINRPIYQLVNLHEFQSARSSHAFRDTILSSLRQNITTEHVNKNKSIFEPQQQQLLPPRRHDTGTTNKNHYHCFDLVEDAITALLKGYIPPPRRQPINEFSILEGNMDDSMTNDKSYDSNYNLSDDYDDQQVLHWSMSTDASANTAKNSALAASPWQERMLHPWWPFTSWTNYSHSNSEDDNDGNEKNTMKDGVEQFRKKYAIDDVKRAQQRLSTLSTTDSDRRHWTALDWLDWFEYDREVKQQEQQQHRWMQLSSDAQKSATNNTYHETHVIDWLSYVDALYNDRSNYANRTSDQQSA
jgi:hypothetical protein